MGGAFERKENDFWELKHEPGQFTLISMGLIRYSCGHISGHHKQIHVKFDVCRFFHHVLLKYCHENAEMQKRKFDDTTLQYSIATDTWFWGIQVIFVKHIRKQVNKDIMVHINCTHNRPGVWYFLILQVGKNGRNYLHFPCSHRNKFSQSLFESEVWPFFI